MNKQYNLEIVKNWRGLGIGGTHNTLVVYCPEKQSASENLIPGKLYLWDGEIYGIRGASVVTDSSGNKHWGIPTKDFKLLPENEIYFIKELFI